MSKTEIQKRLFALQDEGYRNFQARLMPEIDPARIIGVRTPLIRAMSRELSGNAEAEAFLSSLPHVFYEENNLHAALLEKIGDCDKALSALEAFLPYIDNWATCDGFCPKVLRRSPDLLLGRIRVWLRDEHPFTVRYGLVRLTNWYLQEPLFTPEILELGASINREEYYVRMAQAWLFSMALIKQTDATIPYLTERRLSPWVHNKALQKARESHQASKDLLGLLEPLKISTKGKEART